MATSLRYHSCGRRGVKTILLLGIVLAALALPVITARDPDPRRGIRRLLVLLLAINALYLFYVTRIHPIWFVPIRPS